MKLYQSIGPNPRVVTMFIAEKAMDVPRQFIDILTAENRQPDFLAKNPAGGVPVLETDGGHFVAESLAICEYLEECQAASPLIGETPEARAETRATMRTIDQSVIVPMTNGFRGSEGLPMFESRMACFPDAAPGNKAQAQDGLAKLDAALADKAFMCGSRFTLADILLFCFVEFGAQVGQPLPDTLSNLKAWQARVAARPSAAISADPKNGL
jgi:glutathione S-transferase